jgi:coproporphyrinogen III oxidase
MALCEGRPAGARRRGEAMSQAELERRQRTVSAWFENLQTRMIGLFEQLEEEAPGPFAPDAGTPGRFEFKPWNRLDHAGAPGGGGRTAMLRGRLFEKAGIHFVTVFGALAPEFAGQVAGADVDPHFWAAGVSLIAHPRNPNVPTAHFNTRFLATTKQWFGGGADLTPTLDRRRVQSDPDAQAFHASMRQACARHAAVAPYDRFKQWCDEYFYLKHRNEPRGIGGIFYDHLECGDEDARFDANFAFTREVGEAFAQIYPAIVRANFGSPWSEDDREEQLVRRGRYVEFNLLYDRGTTFGLKTGGNIESILSSLPPVVKWR